MLPQLLNTGCQFWIVLTGDIKQSRSNGNDTTLTLSLAPISIVKISACEGHFALVSPRTFTESCETDMTHEGSTATDFVCDMWCGLNFCFSCLRNDCHTSIDAAHSWVSLTTEFLEFGPWHRCVSPTTHWPNWEVPSVVAIHGSDLRLFRINVGSMPFKKWNHPAGRMDCRTWNGPLLERQDESHSYHMSTPLVFTMAFDLFVASQVFCFSCFFRNMSDVVRAFGSGWPSSKAAANWNWTQLTSEARGRFLVFELERMTPNYSRPSWKHYSTASDRHRKGRSSISCGTILA